MSEIGRRGRTRKPAADVIPVHAAPDLSDVSTHDWVISNPGSLIRRAHQIATSLFLEECGGYDCTPLQCAILWRVQNHRGIDQTSLAQSVALDRTTTAKIVLHLEKRKLVRRRVDPNDRRTKRVYITPEGSALVQAMAPAVERARSRVVQPLNAGEVEVFQRLLTKLVDANNSFSRAPLSPDVLEKLAVETARSNRRPAAPRRAIPPAINE